MKTAVRYNLILPLAQRVRWTLEEYAGLTREPEHLKALLSKLVKHQGHKVIAEWHALVDAGEFPSLVASLLELHYDPANARSIRERCTKYNPEVVDVPLSGLDDATLLREVPDSLLPLTEGGPRLPKEMPSHAARPCEEGSGAGGAGDENGKEKEKERGWLGPRM